MSRNDDDQIYDILDLSPSSMFKSNTYNSETPPPPPTSNDHPNLPTNGTSFNFPANYPRLNHQTANNHQQLDGSNNNSSVNISQPSLSTTSNGHTNGNSNFSSNISVNGSLNDTNHDVNIEPTNFLNPRLNTNSINLNLSTNLNNTNSNNNGNNNASMYLSPHSPAQSTHSLYSDYSSQPNSPFYDALSHVSQNQLSEVEVDLHPSNVYLDNNLNTFDHEIGLGGSISSTNLVNLNQPSNQSITNNYANNQEFSNQQSFQNFDNFTNFQPQSMQNSSNQQFNGGIQSGNIHQNNLQQNITDLHNLNLGANNQFQPINNQFYDAHQLEEMNILNKQPPTIVFPKEEARNTPSLFSNSSHNSSFNDDDPQSADLLNPEYSRGRKSSTKNPKNVSSRSNSRSHSRSHSQSNAYASSYVASGSTKSGSRSASRSRSRSRTSLDDDNNENENDYDDEQDDDNQPKNVISTREKMLELASPNQISKRTQKHPSAYACHLCDKRFTRPYNLKSHLRTHTDERPFICNICGKAFARQHDRKRHEDLHSGEKKFQCKGNLKDGTPYGCGRRFARADALRRHFQTEAGKECIRVLIEEEEREKSGQLLSPTTGIPSVAISPPDP